MPAISTAIGLGLAAAGSIAGAVGKKKAANAQQQGAEDSLALQKSNQQQAIDTQNAALARERGLQQPYIAAGSQGLNSIQQLLSKPGEGLLQNYGDFQAPTLEDAEATPGYQFEKQEGINSLDQSAAARGNLFSGTQGKALIDYGNNVATTNYQTAYQNALASYGTNRDTFETNQGNTYNRLRDLAGIGEHATDVLTGEEQAGANNVGNVLVNGANSQSQQINNAAAARASGYRGVGDSIATGLNYGANYALDLNGQQELANENAVTTPYNPSIWVNRGGTYAPNPYPAVPTPQIGAY